MTNVVEMDISYGSSNGSNDGEKPNNSIEEVRKAATREILDTSWNPNFPKDIINGSDEVLPRIMVNNISIDSSNFSQTDLFGKDNSDANKNELKLNDDKLLKDAMDTDTDSLDYCYSIKENAEMRLDDEKTSSSREMTSTSETSFKSCSLTNVSNPRKRRLKSDTNLYKDVHRSKKVINISKSIYHTAGITPRLEKNYRTPKPKPKTSRLMALCSWLGKKGYESLTNFYADAVPLRDKNESEEELREIKKKMAEMDKRQTRLEEENSMLQDSLKKMTQKISELENMMRQQERKPVTVSAPPPPPPPPPPLPPPQPLTMSTKVQRSNTIPRCGSAPTSRTGPRLTITPQDIANVKLRKAKDHPVRTKPKQNDPLPLVTQTMLRTTRAKLGKRTSYANSTPKQELSELEKCLLQESTVTSLYKRRVARATFKSTEELRPRPYPNSRSPLSPRSQRSNSHPRGKHLSPMKYRPLPVNGSAS